MITEITTKAEAFVREILPERLDPAMVYHNLDHTLEVTANCSLLLESIKIEDSISENVILAALFHDTGYTVKIEGHEEESCRMAREFLKREHFPEQRITAVESLIIATSHGVKPQNTAESILRDADILHTGKKGYKKRADLLKKEVEWIRGVPVSDEQWTSENIKFLKTVVFYTKHAKEKFGPGKERNLKKQQALLKELMASEAAKKLEEAAAVAVKTSQSATKGIAGVAGRIIDGFPGDGQEHRVRINPLEQKSTARGVETLFRNITRTHIDLSANADRKANMMISVNSILISILISTLVGRLPAFPHLIAPTIIIISVCMVSLAFAILSSRPNVTGGVVSRDDIENKRGNLLFFGNFHNMSIEDYTYGMEKLMMDAEYLYGSMIRDVYYLGTVLEKKYKYIRYSYDVFGLGLLISVISFVVAIIIG